MDHHRSSPVATRWVLFGLYSASSADSSDRSARKKPDVSATPKPRINQQQKMPAEPPVRMHRHLWMAAKVAAGFLAVLIGLLSGVYGIWGPPWPTAPSFAPGLPASGSPLDVTFNATNASVLFSVPDLFVDCEMVCLRASDAPPPLALGLRHVYVLARGTSHLAPGQTRPFRCPLRGQFGLGRTGESDADVAGRITNAQIVLHSDYFNPWTVWLSRHQALSDRFSLNSKTVPPQWVQGDLPGTCDF